MQLKDLTTTADEGQSPEQKCRSVLEKCDLETGREVMKKKVRGPADQPHLTDNFNLTSFCKLDRCRISLSFKQMEV